MPANYVLLERVEVGETAVSSITFNSIPQTGYTDLKIVASARTSATVGANGYYYNVTFNGISANRSGKYLEGTGSAANSGSFTLYGVSDASDQTASTFSNGELYIPNYTSANYKSASFDSVQENNATASRAIFSAGLWSDVAAITSVTFTPAGGNFVQYSTFSLYGLAAVGTTPTKAPKATGGSIIQTDGTYWYHAFLASGTFTPATGLSCDVLVVAGGGGGASGGGGAGGLLPFTSQSVSTATTITVGAGGAGGNGASGTVGVDSQFGALTLVKGGGYGAHLSLVGGNGGSGGGGGASSSGTYVGGTATSGQGFNGGSQAGQTGSPYSAGGGGGAGAVGGNASGSTSGSGGAGLSTVSPFGSFSSMFTLLGVGVSGSIAGGGGGANYIASGTQGAGGAGGGGGGGNGVTNPGTANTGGGGGAITAGGQAGKGGSGIVIIRYAV